MSSGLPYPMPSGPSETMRMTAQEMHDLVMRVLRRVEFTENEATIIADDVTDAAMCGYRFSGLAKILVVAEHQMKGGPRSPITVVRETPVSAVLDGGNNVAYLPAHQATKIAIEKAKANGFAVVGIYNSRYSGRNAYYLEKIARADLVGIHSTCGGTTTAPPGAARPVMGTNPIAFGFPSSRGPVIFDMTTGSLTRTNLRFAATLDLGLLPEGYGIDEAGLPSRDPKAILRGALLPFGGYKGWGLSFTTQVLGLLGGSAAGGSVLAHGFFFLVFDPNLLLPVEDFKAQLSELIDRIKATPRQPGVEEIRIPSERAFRDRERNLREGIDVDREVVDRLNALL